MKISEAKHKLNVKKTLNSESFAPKYKNVKKKIISCCFPDALFINIKIMSQLNKVVNIGVDQISASLNRKRILNLECLV